MSDSGSQPRPRWNEAAPGTAPGLLMLLLALPTLLPVGAALLTLFDPWSSHWPHLLRVVLPDVARNTLLLMVLVASLAGLIGTGLAWLMARYAFPGSRLLHAALLLPLAMPGYVLGFVAIAGLDYAGPLQHALRGMLDTSAPLWQVRSLTGAAVVLSLTLYPYVYLIAYNAFRSISSCTLEVAASLGQTAVFRRIALPLALPWIAGGLLLVSMEVLADFGTVALFNVNTFTTAIYKSWFGLFSLDAALQLATILILLALALGWAHRRMQRRGRMSQDGSQALPTITLRGGRACAASLGLSLFVLLVAGLPLITLAWWSWSHVQVELDPRYGEWLGRSLLLAFGTAALLTLVALLMGYIERRHTAAPVRALARTATLGYALPGTVLAVGLYAPLAGLERQLAGLLTPGWATQSLIVVLLGYWGRFLAVAHTPITQQLARITPSLDDVSRSLGLNGLQVLNRVHRPMISGALASAAALLIIDIIKEMPITLMTRPAGWDTLATRVYELTAEGEYTRAALPALTIVLAGLVPVILLLRVGRTARSSAPAGGLLPTRHAEVTGAA